MNRLDVGGVKLEVVHVTPPLGKPRRVPIVFLHEGLGSVALWRDWPAQLCRHAGRAGCLYSRRGYGQSDAVPDVRGEPATQAGLRSGRLLPDYLQHEAWNVLPALLHRLEIERPVLVGHSDGASIALLYASRYPVAACIAMAPHVMVEPMGLEAIEQAKVAFEGGDLRRRLARYHANVDCAFWQWNDVWLSQAFRSFDIREDCRRIDAPVLAIQGRDDPYGTVAQIEQIDLPPQCIQRVVMAHCGHSPHRDQMEETTALITTFLAAQA